jgi:tetratricopeptide (TPR) repeat protein
LLGLIARRAGYADAATDLFRQAVARAPGYAEAWTNLGRVLLDRNKSAEALNAFAAGLKGRPDYWPAQSGLAKALAKEGDTAAAIDLLVSAAAQHAGQSAPAVELGNVLQAEGQHREAIQAYSQALDREPGLTPALSNRAAARLKGGDPAGALDDAEAYLATGTKSANVVAYKVLALQLLGRHDEARAVADIDTMVYPVTPAADPSFPVRLEAEIRAHPKLIDDWDPTLRAARNGKVVQDLTRDPTPTIAAFLQMIGDAVEDLKAGLPDQSGHPFFGAKPARYQMIVWANILGTGGHQAAHIHNYGWVSGVYYPSLPTDISDAGDAGWISFGTPGYGLPTAERTPTRSLKPCAGGMFLFPSYVWHHTIPLDTGAERLSIAFDIVPR